MHQTSIQGEGVLAKSKSQSSPGTMQARFPTGEPFHGRGSCVSDLAPHWLFRVRAGSMPCRMDFYTWISYPCASLSFLLDSCYEHHIQHVQTELVTFPPRSASTLMLHIKVSVTVFHVVAQRRPLGIAMKLPSFNIISIQFNSIK